MVRHRQVHGSVYDIDGQSYPCQTFTPLVLSCERTRECRRRALQNEALLEDPKCWGCPGYFLCPTCYGLNFKLTGNPAIRDEAMCRLFKVQLLENCRFQTEILKRKKGGFGEQEWSKAKAILNVHEKLASSHL